MQLMQIIPTSAALFAVFTDEHGVPRFEPVSCLGIIEIEVAKDIATRVVAGYVHNNGHLVAADWEKFHVGYTNDPSSDPSISESWSDRCKAKLKKIAELEEAAKQQKIVVPEKKIAKVFQN